MVSVLALIAASEVTGPCRGLFQLAAETDRLDVRLTLGMFLLRSHVSVPSIEEARRRGFPVEVLAQGRRYDPRLVAQAWRLVRAHRVELVQSHGYKPALLAWSLKQMTGLPWVAFAHGYTSQGLRVAAYNHLDRWLMRRADRVVAVSESMASELSQAGVREDRIRVIRNAIDPSDYRPDADGAQVRHAAGAGPEDLLIGVIGRLSPEKGQEVFIRALRRVVQVVPQAKAVLVGEGEQAGVLRAALQAQGLERRVSLTGYHRDISPIYAALDLVVVPSLSEGLPNVLLESMLHGKAVVATGVGGTREVMSGWIPEWTVPAGDPDALARAMIEALLEARRRATLGQRGARRVRAHFSSFQRAEHIKRVYHELAC